MHPQRVLGKDSLLSQWWAGDADSGDRPHVCAARKAAQKEMTALGRRNLQRGDLVKCKKWYLKSSGPGSAVHHIMEVYKHQMLETVSQQALTADLLHT